MLFQKALREKDKGYKQELKDLDAIRRDKYPVLMEQMRATRKPYVPKHHPPLINWPKYRSDPLWRVFKHGVPFDDPYNALLAALDPEGYSQALAAGQAAEWLEANRWRGKRGFLALAYGSQAEALAPQLKWSVEQTRQAIVNLETEYATLGPLRELTKQRLIHLGMVRNLWGRPRRINGYYQLAGTEPVTVRFYRLRPNPRHYIARIIPLGTTQQGVQCFVEKCQMERSDGRLETVLAGNPNGTLKYKSLSDPFVLADHFNRVPFRNLNFDKIEWVKDENGLIRYLARQERGLRQAFNSLCQSTGADHLRWLMNRVDEAIRWAGKDDCKLILTVHDSLVYEVPERQTNAFIKLVLPIVRKRPPWSTLDIKADVEVGKRFGEMTKHKGN
jgi:hypothetical protein